MCLKTLNKKIFLTILIITIITTGSFILYAQKTHEDIKYPKLRKIEIPEVERRILSNGMVLFLLEDHRLPLINARILVKTGSIFEPADKVGLAGITGEVLRTGGTKSKTGEEIDEELENIAASVETSIGMNSGYATMSTLKEDVDRGLNILADILMNPAFREDKIDLAKVQVRSLISRRNDEPMGIISREFDMLIYGKESPYARIMEYDTINNIKQEDLFAFHEKYFYPKNSIMGVWGDFNKDEMIAKIEEVFKAWKKADISLPSWPVVNEDIPPSVNYIEKQDLTQSYISLGHLGIKTSNPDYYALQVMNYILIQGGFTSRLMKKIRSDMGLTYGIFGGVDDQYNYPGVFSIGTFTKSKSTAKAISSIIDEIKLFKDKGVTEEELKIAKDSYFNKFVFNFDTKGEIVARKMAYEYYGLPLDFLEQARDKIEKVTVADVNSVANKYLHPEKLVILAVGKEEDFDQPLSTFGDVNKIDITIKEPTVEAPTIPPATPESIEQARDIMIKAADAMGGLETFKNLQNLIITYNSTINTPQGEIALGGKIYIIYPNKARIEMNTPMGQIVQIINEEEAWVETPQGIQDIPIKEAKENIFRDQIMLLKNLDNEAVTFQYLGIENFQGKDAHNIYIFDQEDNKLRLYIDTSSFDMLGMKYVGSLLMSPPSELVVVYSDFKETENIRYPTKEITLHEGKPAMSVTVSEIKINPEINEELFIKKEK
jgi:predicted Zn-dependent peptidase/outer membrane lipoprotein-sorting protein